MQPYFYKIKHINTGKYYVGAQYGKNSDPTKFWQTYFTSSKSVNALIQLEGKESFEIIEIVQRDDAREFERRYLKKCFGMFGRQKFLSTFLNRNIAPGILLTKDIIEKANIKRKISNSISAKKLITEGRHNFQLKNASDCSHVREQRSIRMRGNKHGAKRIMTDELKSKLSGKSKGNTNVRGTRWWTDGEINKRSKECPGENFRLGTTK